MRKIIHIDMDAFFASAEQLDNPALRGIPLAVGADGPRGVVATASYEARRFGVRSAMSMAEAHRRCPDLVVVPPRMSRYKQLSAQVMDIFSRFTDLIEPISIDEAFLDVTHNKPGLQYAMDVAVEIKAAILRETGLTASAGVSHCKLLAKIASDLRKPNGLVVVHPDQALGFVESLPVEKFWGVGPKTAERMHALGIHTGADLRACTHGWLVARFGKAGHLYYEFARARDPRPVTVERVRKSVGCEETYLRDLVPEEAFEALEALIPDLTARMRRNNFLAGKTLTLKVRFSDFSQMSRSLSVREPIEPEFDPIRTMALHIWADTFGSEGPQKPVRLLGLSVAAPPSHEIPDSIWPRLFPDV